MTTAATAPAPAPTYELIPPSKISDFPLNPREHWGDMTELEASIKAQGVLEPILVRRSGDRYQVIAGARRLRAARAAALGVIPTIVREATDAQALEIALVENTNRHDVHRLNEAIAIESLMKLDRAYTPAAVAAKLGRPEKYVRETLKLLSLTPAVRKAYAEDAITAGHAVILSRLPADQQGEALGACFGQLWTGDGEDKVLKSVKALEVWVRDHAPLELASPSQETRDLFPEAVKLAQTETAIVQVHHGYGDVKRKGSKEVIRGEGSWKKAAAKDACAQAGVVVLGRDKGQILRVCTDRTCAKHFPKPKRQASPSTPRSSKQQRAAEKASAERAAAKRALDERYAAAVIGAIADKVTGLTLALGRLLLEDLTDFGLELTSDPLEELFAKVSGLKVQGGYGAKGNLEKLSETQVARALLVGVLARDAYNVKALEPHARAFKVDAKKIRTELEREAAAAAKAAKAEAKATAKAKAKTPKKDGRK